MKVLQIASETTQTSSWQANDKLIAVWKKDKPRSLVTDVCSGAVES